MYLAMWGAIVNQVFATYSIESCREEVNRQPDQPDQMGISYTR